MVVSLDGSKSKMPQLRDEGERRRGTRGRGIEFRASLTVLFGPRRMSIAEKDNGDRQMIGAWLIGSQEVDCSEKMGKGRRKSEIKTSGAYTYMVVCVCIQY